MKMNKSDLRLLILLALALAGVAAAAFPSPARAAAPSDDSVPIDRHIESGTLSLIGELGVFNRKVRLQEGQPSYVYAVELSYQSGDTTLECSLSYVFHSPEERPPVAPRMDLKIAHVAIETSKLHGEAAARPYLTHATVSFSENNRVGTLDCARQSKVEGMIVLGELREMVSSTEARVEYKPPVLANQVGALVAPDHVRNVAPESVTARVPPPPAPSVGGPTPAAPVAHPATH